MSDSMVSWPERKGCKGQGEHWGARTMFTSARCRLDRARIRHAPRLSPHAPGRAHADVHVLCMLLMKPCAVDPVSQIPILVSAFAKGLGHPPRWRLGKPEYNISPPICGGGTSKIAYIVAVAPEFFACGAKAFAFGKSC